ncbi:MAG: sensor histidine kinase [Christensenellales bacterium]
MRFEEADTPSLTTEHTLNFATEEMQRVETLRQDLLANISHDLKTPLTIIKSYAELIKDITGDNKAKREEQLDVIIDEAKRLTELVNEILVVSQQNSTSKLNKTDFDFSELVESVVKKFDFDNSGYNFRRDVKKGLWVNADRHKIEQVLSILSATPSNIAARIRRLSLSSRRRAAARASTCSTTATA